MEIKFENFAKAGNGSVTINDLTVIYGPNNSGKTYISYAIFAVLDNFEKYFHIGLNHNQLKKLVEKLISHGTAEIDVSNQIKNINKVISKIENKITENLHNYFSLQDEFFSGAKISILFGDINLYVKDKIDGSVGDFLTVDFFNKPNEKVIVLTLMNHESKVSPQTDREHLLPIVFWMINQVIFDAFLRKLLPIPFPITSERTGISLFHKVFDNKNSEILDKIVTIDNATEISNIIQIIPTYALPIKRDIEKIRFFEEYSKKRSFITKAPKKYENLLTNLSKLVEGTYSSTDGAVFYHPDDSANLKNEKIPLHAASSSVKAMFTLYIFIYHLADNEKSQILIIDEPELNLHPEKQVLMARLVAELVNAGTKVLVTTHSDFFIREINNLVMLNNQNKKYKKNVMKEHGFNENEILDHSRISAYNTTMDLIVKTVEVDKFGINSTMFDDVFNYENKKRQDVYLNMEKDT